MTTFKRLLSIAMVIALAATCFAVTSLAEKGTITVDGTLDDTGYSADRWFTVNEETGKIQSPHVITIGDFAYDYQFVVDGDYLYIAVKSNKAPEATPVPEEEGAEAKVTQTSCTNLRLWLDTNADGTRDYLIDFGMGVDYEPVVSRINDNQTPDDAKADVEALGIQYKNSKTENSYSMEIAIKLSALTPAVGETFKYVLTLSAPNAGTYTIDSKEGSEKKYKEGDLTYEALHYPPYPLEIGEDADGYPAILDKQKDAPWSTTAYYGTATVAELGLADVGTQEPVEESDFGWTISVPKDIEAGAEFDVTVTLSGVKDVKIGTATFVLEWSENIVPKTTEPANAIDPFIEFMTKGPEGFESFSKYSEDGYYVFSFGGAITSAAADGDIVLTIPFVASEDLADGDTVSLSIGYDEAKVEAVGLTLSNVADDLTTALVAGEATASVVIGEVDESSTPAEDSSAASSDDSSVPGTSDAGIFAIVAVAVVAVLGAAVVIRKRA